MPTRRAMLAEWHSFVRGDSHILRNIPSLLFQQAANQPASTHPALSARERLTAGAERRPWLRWINRPQGPSACLLTLADAPEDIGAVVTTPDGRLVVAAGAAGAVRVWDGENGLELHRFELQRNDRLVAAVSRSGQSLLVILREDSFPLLDPLCGLEVGRLAARPARATAVALGTDALSILSGHEDGTLKFWSAAREEPRQVFRGHPGPVYRAALSPDARVAASAGREGSVKVWDPDAGRLRATLALRANEVSFLGLTEDNRHVVVACADSGTDIRDAAGYDPSRIAPPGGTARVAGTVSILIGGQESILSVISNNSLRVFSADSGRERLALEEPPHFVHAVALMPEGRVVSANESHTLRIREVATGRLIGSFDGHPSRIGAISVTLDGKRICSGGVDRAVRVWDASRPESPQRASAHGDSITALAVSPGGERVVSGGSDGTLQVGDVARGDARHELPGHRGLIKALAITPDGTRVIAGSQDTTLSICELQHGRRLHLLRGHAGRPSKEVAGVFMNAEILAVAVTPDGGRVMSASGDSTLKVWEVATGRMLATLEGHTSGVNRVIISPDGRYAVSVGHERRIIVWDLARGKKCRRLPRIWYGSTHALAFLPTGREFVSASGVELLIWKLTRRGRPKRFESQLTQESNLVVDPDGRWIAGVTDEPGHYGITIWDTGTGAVVQRLGGFRGDLCDLVGTSDGRYLVAGGKDRTLRVWEVASGAPVGRAVFPASISAVAAEAGLIAVGDSAGKVYLLQQNNLPIGPRNLSAPGERGAQGQRLRRWFRRFRN